MQGKRSGRRGTSRAIGRRAVRQVGVGGGRSQRRKRRTASDGVGSGSSGPAERGSGFETKDYDNLQDSELHISAASTFVALSHACQYGRPDNIPVHAVRVVFNCALVFSCHYVMPRLPRTILDAPRLASSHSHLSSSLPRDAPCTRTALALPFSLASLVRLTRSALEKLYPEVWGEVKEGDAADAAARAHPPVGTDAGAAGGGAAQWEFNAMRKNLARHQREEKDHFQRLRLTYGRRLRDRIRELRSRERASVTMFRNSERAEAHEQRTQRIRYRRMREQQRLQAQAFSKRSASLDEQLTLRLIRSKLHQERRLLAEERMDAREEARRMAAERRGRISSLERRFADKQEMVKEEMERARLASQLASKARAGAVRKSERDLKAAQRKREVEAETKQHFLDHMWDEPPRAVAMGVAGAPGGEDDIAQFLRQRKSNQRKASSTKRSGARAGTRAGGRTGGRVGRTRGARRIPRATAWEDNKDAVYSDGESLSGSGHPDSISETVSVDSTRGARAGRSTRVKDRRKLLIQTYMPSTSVF